MTDTEGQSGRCPTCGKTKYHDPSFDGVPLTPHNMQKYCICPFTPMPATAEPSAPPQPQGTLPCPACGNDAPLGTKDGRYIYKPHDFSSGWQCTNSGEFVKPPVSAAASPVVETAGFVSEVYPRPSCHNCGEPMDVFKCSSCGTTTEPVLSVPQPPAQRFGDVRASIECIRKGLDIHNNVTWALERLCDAIEGNAAQGGAHHVDSDRDASCTSVLTCDDRARTHQHTTGTETSEVVSSIPSAQPSTMTAEFVKLEREFAESTEGSLLTQAMHEVTRELGMEDKGVPQCETCKMAAAYVIQLAAKKAMHAFSAEQNAALTREVAQLKAELADVLELRAGYPADIAMEKLVQAEREVADLRAQLDQAKNLYNRHLSGEGSAR